MITKHTHKGNAMWRHREKTAIYKPGRETSEDSNSADINLRLLGSGTAKNNFCGSSHLFHGALLL